MMELHPFQTFEPSPTVKRLFRPLRHSAYEIESATVPGMMSHDGFALLTAAFVSVLVLEAWGLWNIWRVTQLGLSIVLSAVLVDVVLAVLAHLGAANQCEQSTRLLVAETPDERDRIKASRGTSERWMLLGAAVIVLVALLKFALFWDITGMATDGATLAVCLSYFVVAALHIKCTGQFIYACFGACLLWGERRQFRKELVDDPQAGKLQARSRTLAIHSRAPVTAAPVDLHSIEIDAQGQPRLRAVGVLMDKQVQGLCQSQRDPEARLAVLKAALKLQLMMLGTEGGSAIPSTPALPGASSELAR